jgi:hypothetical protein
VPEITPLATSVSNKPVIQNRVDPAAQIAIGAALVPASKRPFEAVLDKVVGALSVTAQQRVCVSAQSGDVRFEKFISIPRWRVASLHQTTLNTEPACGIAKCSQATTDQRPEE